jgi:hypothetical protein
LWSVGVVGIVCRIMLPHAMSKCCQYSTYHSKKMMVWVQSQSRKHGPYCKRLSLGLKRVVRDNNNGIKHAWVWGCHHGSSRHLWRLGLLQKSSYSKRLLSSSMSLPFAMEDNNHWLFKVVFWVPRFGQ